MSEANARTLVIDAVHRLVDEGLVARTWGNVSARIDDTYFIITPSGKSYEQMTAADLVKVAIADCSYEPEVVIDGKTAKVKPSSEKGIHADAYKLRPEINFVIHTHQHYASAVGAAGEDVQVGADDARTSAAGKDTYFAPCAAYGLPGTKKLRKNVAAAYAKKNPSGATCNAVLMERHGAVVLGKTAEEAFDEALKLEEVCKKLFEEKCGTKIIGAAGTAVVAAAAKPEKPYLDDYAQLMGFSGKAPEGEDPQAIKLVTAKNEAAGAFAREAGPMNFFDVLLQHIVYKKKYSKLKDKN